MKKGSLWLIAPLLPTIWILLNTAKGIQLFQDSDTKFLLLKLAERNNPLSWFCTDWPLENHFYRPVSTLFFEFDRAVYGQNPNGFGFTQALIAIACIFLTFWMVRELTNSPAKAGLASGLLATWTAGWPVGSWISEACWLGAALACTGLTQKTSVKALAISAITFAFLVGVNISSGWESAERIAVMSGVATYVVFANLDNGFKTFPLSKIGPVLAAVAGLAFIAQLTNPPQPLTFRILDWLPGRTASVMTIFALVSVAAYARFERLGAGLKQKQATAEDIPSTRGQAAVLDHTKRPWLIALTYVSACLALASYEQAVMVPAILTGTAIFFAWSGRKPRWTIPLSSWALLALYWLVRHAFVPATTSGYQAQQMRGLTPGAIGSLIDFAFPGYRGFTQLTSAVEGFPFSLMATGPWFALMLLAGNVVLWYWVWKSRERWLWITSTLMTLVSFFPMAFVKMFEHYYFWPSCFWCLAAVSALSIGADRLINVLGPQGRSAPPRTSPAPGSLPHQ